MKRTYSINLAYLSCMFAGAFVATFAALAAYNWVNNDSNAPLVLHADTASSGKQISMATGFIDDGVEGLFVLDHLTGNIQCVVINRRTGELNARFTGSATTALGADKGGSTDFVMATGRVDFNKGSGQNRPAGCVCYVAEGNSGKFVGFGLRYNSQAAAKGKPQTGTLEVVCRGITRNTAARRDQ